MKLLVVSQYFWPEEFRVNDLVRGLRERGHEVTVLTGQPNYPSGEIFPEFRKNPTTFNEYEGVPVIRAPLVPRGRGGAARLIFNYLSFAVSGTFAALTRLRGERFDATIVFQTSPITAAFPALAAKRVTGGPVLLWVQDLWPDTLSAIGVIRSPALLGVVGAMVGWIYRRCDRILIQSRAFEPRIRVHAPKSTPIHYLPNWFEAFYSADPARESSPPELSDFANSFNVMFAGNLGEAQDLLTVAKAASLCKDQPDIRWLIVGDGRARDALHEEIERLGVGDVVHLLGRHPAKRMPSFFRAASALLVSLKPEPIWAMTIPSKLQNYMAAGRPVLGMLDGEGARVIAESECGMVSPAGDAQSLARNVKAMAAASVASRDSMGRRGQAYAEQHFEREALIDNLDGWLKEAVTDRNSSIDGASLGRG